MDFAKIAEENIILKVRVGSHLFGTNTPSSDLDYEGVFMPNRHLLCGLHHCKEVDLGIGSKDASGRNTKDAIDFKLREYRDFCRLALDNNPNILNILFANEENIEHTSCWGENLQKNAHLFPHQGGTQKYIAYAKSQIKKMGLKPENHKHLEEALFFLEKENQDDIFAYSVERATEKGITCMVDNGPGKHIKVGDIYVERALKTRKAVAQIKERLARASHRADTWRELGFDPKFASNVIQILFIGIELATTGKIDFPLKNRDTVLDVKLGKWKQEEVIQQSEYLVEYLENVKSVLPSKPRTKEVEKFVEMQVWNYVSCAANF